MAFSEFPNYNQARNHTNFEPLKTAGFNHKAEVYGPL
jgi:hypothetical protein